MIFDGHLELRERNDLRFAGLDRKRKMLGPRFKGAGALEMEAFECLEHLMQKDSSLPFVEIVEYEGDEENTGSYSEISPDGFFKIYIDAKEVARLQLYIEEIFGKPWSDDKIRMMKEQRKVTYHRYEQSIYDLPFFRFFAGCKVNIEEFVSRIALWFIILHEYAHVKNGHLRYKQFMKLNGTPVPREVSQAMELHADITAATWLLEILFDSEKFIGKKQIVVQNNGKNPGVVFADNVAFMAIAAYLSLRCYLKEAFWDEWSVGMHRGNPNTHPMTELRMSVVYNVLLQGVLTYFAGTTYQTSMANSMLATVSGFEKFYFQNEGHEDEWVGRVQYIPTELLRTDVGKAYYKEVFENVLDLNRLLSPYTNTPSRVEGTWCDYETLPERMFWQC